MTIATTAALRAAAIEPVRTRTVSAIIIAGIR
jgi:hypothetical protein